MSDSGRQIGGMRRPCGDVSTTFGVVDDVVSTIRRRPDKATKCEGLERVSDLDAARQLLSEVDAELRAAGELLNIAKAAKRAGVQPKTVRRWYHSGQLPGMQSKTGRIRIPAQALAAFLAAR